MIPVSVLIVGVLMIYVAATGRGEAVWKALTKPLEKKK